MELKPVCTDAAPLRTTLLIVPYGIETVLRIPLISLTSLLIVPYGIETRDIA